MSQDAARLASTEWSPSDQFEPLTFEKMIGLNNLLSIAWLSRGLELAAPVARVLTLAGPGTCFLIGPNLMLTNHHVIPDLAVADKAVVEFNYQYNWSGTPEPVSRYMLDSAYFQTNEELDYTIVRVKENPGNTFGHIDLTARAIPSVNDYVSIIQHPQGGPKQICVTDNKVAAVFGDLLQYSTDTEPGSSGSPVFNQNWQIVGLHHKGGGLAGPDGETHFTNEGILINAILRDAASFLGLPDVLYDLSFGELRATLARMIEKAGTAAEVAKVAETLIRTRPRFPIAVDEWAAMNSSPEDTPGEAVCAAGIAIGAALRQWARDAGHESIKTAAMSDPKPTAKLYELIGAFKGSDALPSDVHAKVLAGVRDVGLAATIANAFEPDTASLARCFLTGVALGARAYDGPPRTRRTTKR